MSRNLITPSIAEGSQRESLASFWQYLSLQHFPVLPDAAAHLAFPWKCDLPSRVNGEWFACKTSMHDIWLATLGVLVIAGRCLLLFAMWFLD